MVSLHGCPCTGSEIRIQGSTGPGNASFHDWPSFAVDVVERRSRPRGVNRKCRIFLQVGSSCLLVRVGKREDWPRGPAVSASSPLRVEGGEHHGHDRGMPGPISRPSFTPGSVSTAHPRQHSSRHPSKVCRAQLRGGEPSGGGIAECHQAGRTADGATDGDCAEGVDSASGRRRDGLQADMDRGEGHGGARPSQLVADLGAGQSTRGGDKMTDGHGKFHPAPGGLGPRLGRWLLNVVAVGYAATAVIMKALEDPGGGPSAAAPTSLEFFLRFGTAALSIGLLLQLRHSWVAQQQGGRRGELQAALPGSVVGPGMELGVWMFGTYAGQAMGLETSSADHAALLLTLSVVLVPLLEALGGRAMSRSVGLATALACLGMVLLETGQSPEGAHSVGAALGGIPLGHLWCLAGAACSAVHVVRSEALCVDADPLGLVLVQLATAAGLSVPWVLWDVAHGAGGWLALVGSLGGIPWPMIFLAGPLGTGLCEWLELEALRFVDASTATLILTASPLWGSLMAYAFLGETLDRASLAGGLLILLASLQVQLGGSGGSEDQLADSPRSASRVTGRQGAMDDLEGAAGEGSEKRALVPVVDGRHPSLSSARGLRLGLPSAVSTRLRRGYKGGEGQDRAGKQEDARWHEGGSFALLRRLKTGLMRR